MNRNNPIYSGKPLWAVLRGEQPDRIVYAPNYWQWFTHRLNHKTLPEEIQHCRSQLDLIQYLGLDVFSRNIYSNPYTGWFGGLCEEHFSGIEKMEQTYSEGQDRIIEKTYETGKGTLTESLRYIHRESTLVQKKFLIDDYENQLDLLEVFVRGRSWQFNPDNYEKTAGRVGPLGVVVAGEFFSPLKMFHLLLGLANTTYLVVFHEARARELAKVHEAAQLNLLKQMLEGGVKVVMSMDNLDSMFHPPDHVDAFSASFYEKASALCHEHDARFFIHACGQQKANLPLISSLGVDGLEGVAYPPLGDVELDEAFSLVHDKFIITGGISAFETEKLREKEEIFKYVRELFQRMKPFAHRFIFSASCNTAINTPWETIKYFRDAWLEYGSLD